MKWLAIGRHLMMLPVVATFDIVDWCVYKIAVHVRWNALHLVLIRVDRNCVNGNVHPILGMCLFCSPNRFPIQMKSVFVYWFDLIFCWHSQKWAFIMKMWCALPCCRVTSWWHIKLLYNGWTATGSWMIWSYHLALLLMKCNN